MAKGKKPKKPVNNDVKVYQHEMDWTNRLILGDSLLVMSFLLERKMMGGVRPFLLTLHMALSFPRTSSCR
jgi:hypothetical protein